MQSNKINAPDSFTSLVIIVILSTFQSVDLVAKPSRSTKVVLVNNTAYNIVLTSVPNVAHGIITKSIPSEIFPNTIVEFGSESKGFLTGTEVWVHFILYKTDCNGIVDGNMILHWDNPYYGSNSYKDTGVPQGFTLSKVGGSGNRTTVTWTLAESGVSNYMTPLILADDPITSMELTIHTSDIRDAGTDNVVFFSIGPYSWKLEKPGDEFERNQTDHYPLPCSGLRLSDIMYYHLEKKGTLLGKAIYGASDFPGGEWHPEWIQLKVNGIDLPKRKINTWIGSPNNPMWMSMIQECKTIPFKDRVVNSLRIPINEEVTGPLMGAVTTPVFKEQNLSGWIEIGECNKDQPGKIVVTLQGTVARDPVISTDGFVTIDVSLLNFNLCFTNYAINDFEKFGRARYVRIEHMTSPALAILQPAAILSTMPKNGCLIDAEGVLKWDTDDEGWWEIHTSTLKIVECPSK